MIYLVSRGVSHRASDVRLDTGVPFVASDFCRRTHWQWKVIMSYKWRKSGHITQLEAIAVQDLLKKMARSAAGLVSIPTKGWSSARQLQQPLRRRCALLIASNSRLLVGWVKSEWNPADGPSRWTVKSAMTDA